MRANALQHFRAQMVATEGTTARLLYLTAPEVMDPTEPLAIGLGPLFEFSPKPIQQPIGWAMCVLQ
jgi:hypothetical protein